MKNTMKILSALAVVAALAAPTGVVAKNVCFVDYKAKQQSTGGGLRLHYGVIGLKDPACSNRRAGGKPVAGDEVAVEKVAPDKPSDGVPHLRKRS